MECELQIKQWEQWGQNAQVQFQQQLQQQLAALNQQLSEKHRAEIEELRKSHTSTAAVPAAGTGTANQTSQEEVIARLKAEHEEEMKVIVDTAEEEATSLRERITELENQLQSAVASAESAGGSAASEQNQELQELRDKLEQYKQTADQIAEVS